MKQEEKNLLLKDLCGRLPYEIKVHYQEEICSIDCICPDGRILLIDKYGTQLPNIGDNLFEEIDNIKLYLRSMSSMTEKEKEQFEELTYNEHEDFETTTGRRMILATDSDTGYGSEYFSKDISEVVDWLNYHHIDYRGLIEKGLALEAPDDMYNN